jgi:hypothetical protein
MATLPSSTAKLTRQPTAICTLLSRATNTITPVNINLRARSEISYHHESAWYLHRPPQPNAGSASCRC